MSDTPSSRRAGASPPRKSSPLTAAVRAAVLADARERAARALGPEAAAALRIDLVDDDDGPAIRVRGDDAVIDFDALERALCPGDQPAGASSASAAAATSAGAGWRGGGSSSTP